MASWKRSGRFFLEVYIDLLCYSGVMIQGQAKNISIIYLFTEDELSFSSHKKFVSIYLQQPERDRSPWS